MQKHICAAVYWVAVAEWPHKLTGQGRGCWGRLLWASYNLWKGSSMEMRWLGLTAGLGVPWCKKGCPGGQMHLEFRQCCFPSNFFPGKP